MSHRLAAGVLAASLCTPALAQDVEVSDGETTSGNFESDVQSSTSRLGQNMFGGRLGTASQVILSTGFPHGIKGDFRFQFGQFEVAPIVYFDWGNSWGGGVDLGTGAGLYFRANVFSQDGWDIAIRFGALFDFRFLNNFQFGVNLGDPGVRVSKNIAQIVDIDFGLDFIPQLQFGPRAGGVDFDLAVPFVFGAEGDVAPGIQVGFTARGGPNFGDVNRGGNPVVGPFVEGLIHVGISLGNVKKGLSGG